MTQQPYVTDTTLPVAAEITMTSNGWQARLIAKVDELRRAGKRAILLVDGMRVFIFVAEPKGTIALE